MAAQTAQITAKKRSELGSRRNKRLRNQGLVPGVIYGHKEAVIPVTLPKKELVGHLDHGTHVFNVALDGKNEQVLVKDVQYDHLGIEVLHIDFARVSLDEKVEVTVPIILKGEPKGEDDGGVLQQNLAELEVECTVLNIPSEIRHNVADMALNDVVLVKDLKLPEGVRALQDAELVVCAVREVQEEVPTEVAEAATAEPEVIGRKPEDEAAATAEGEEKKEKKE